MNINAPLSIRRRMGLEIFRRLENERTDCLLYTSDAADD